MLINAKFEGLVKEVINTLVNKGIAASKAEAVRIMALEYYKQNQSFFKNDQDKCDIMKLQPEQWKAEFRGLRKEIASMSDEEVDKSILEGEKKMHKEWANVH